MSKRLIAEQMVQENGHQQRPVEPISLPVVRKWYVQVQVVHSGRLQGQPFVFGTQAEAAAAMEQLEREHRAMGWTERYDVVCWAE